MAGRGCDREREREREYRRAKEKEKGRESGLWVKRGVRLAWLGWGDVGESRGTGERRGGGEESSGKGEVDEERGSPPRRQSPVCRERSWCEDVLWFRSGAWRSLSTGTSNGEERVCFHATRVPSSRVTDRRRSSPVESTILPARDDRTSLCATVSGRYSTVKKPAACATTRRVHEEYERPSCNKERHIFLLIYLCVSRPVCPCSSRAFCSSVCNVSRDCKLLITVLTHQRRSLLERLRGVARYYVCAYQCLRDARTFPSTSWSRFWQCCIGSMDFIEAARPWSIAYVSERLDRLWTREQFSRGYTALFLLAPVNVNTCGNRGNFIAAVRGVAAAWCCAPA